MKNQRRPEASIIEWYIAEEAIEFCIDYLAKMKPVDLLKSRIEGMCHGKVHAVLMLNLRIRRKS